MEKICVICKEPFETIKYGHTRVTCSPACHRKKKSQQGRATYFRLRGRDAPPPKPPVKLTEAQKGYIAGIIDGEGSLMIVKRKRDWKRCTHPHYHRPQASVAQAKKPILDYLMEVLGESDLNINHQKGIWELRFHPPCLKWLLPQIKPYLVLKRRQAEILIEFMAECRYQGKELTDEQWNRRETLRLEISELNTKPKTKRESS